MKHRWLVQAHRVTPRVADLFHKKQVVAMYAADGACVIGLLSAR